MAIIDIATLKGYFETLDVPTQTQFENLIDTLNASLPSTHRMLSCVIRNTGAGWFLITTGGHTPINIDGISEDTDYIYLDYTSLGATNPANFIIGNDEDFIGIYNAGLETTNTTAKIRITKPIISVLKAKITHSGSGVFVSDNADVVPTYNNGTGILTLTHSGFTSTDYTPRLSNEATSDANRTLFQNATSGISNTALAVKLYNFGGTQKTLINPEIDYFYFERRGVVLEQNIQSPADVISAIGNFWLLGIIEL